MNLSLSSLSTNYRALEVAHEAMLIDFMIESSKGRFDAIERLDQDGRKQWVNDWLSTEKTEKGKLYVLVSDEEIHSWLGHKWSERDPHTIELSLRFDVNRFDLSERIRITRELITELFKHKEVSRLEVWISADDQLSRDLLVRCGFRLEGTLRMAMSTRSGRTDTGVFGLLKTDFTL